MDGSWSSHGHVRHWNLSRFTSLHIASRWGHLLSLLPWALIYPYVITEPQDGHVENVPWLMTSTAVGLKIRRPKTPNISRPHA